MKNVIFYYPSKSIGGAQLLFIRIANELVKRNKYNVHVIDYRDGFLSRNCHDGVIAVNYIENKKYLFSGRTIVIVPLSMIDYIDNVITFHDDCLCLCWCIHPENAIDILKGAFRLKKILSNYLLDGLLKIINITRYARVKGKILTAILENQLVFMDKATKDRTFEFYNIDSQDVPYLPIPININSTIIDYSIINKENIAWIGRLSNDKIYSLLFVLDYLDNIESKNINVYIVGDGDYSCLIDINKYAKLHIIQCGFIDNNKLGLFLKRNKVGMVFGMGTSLLESSVLGLPSLLIDPSYSRLNDNYSPCWLFETTEYTLGTFKHSENRKSISAVVKDYFNDDINAIGAKCYDYVRLNHSFESVINKLEFIID
jgi:hypothetical protein